MADTKVLKSYRGNCHCGSYIFELKVPEITVANECNCSLCAKKGYLFTFPGDGLTVVKGEGSLREYTFNAGNMRHQFCPTCGTPVKAYMTTSADKNAGINVRTVQGLDIWKLEIKPFDGKNYGAPYNPPKYTGPEPTADIEGGKLYTGGCHCGAVTVCIRTKPLDGSFPDRIVECNCSNCQRAAYLWIYPKTDQVVIQGRENLSYYVFGKGAGRKAFCKTCGVHIMNEPNPSPTPEQVEGLSPMSRAFLEGKLDLLPINIRVLNDLDFDAIKEKVQHADGWNTSEPPYVNP